MITIDQGLLAIICKLQLQIQMYRKKSTRCSVHQSMFMLLYALLITFHVRHTDNFRFVRHHCIGDLMAHTMIWKRCTVNDTDKVLFTCKTKFQKKATDFPYNTNHKNSFLLGLFIWVLGFPVDIFVNGYIEIPLITYCLVKLPINEK